MASDLSSYKVTAGEVSSDTKFNNLVQAIQNALNAIGDTTQTAFAAGLILDGTQIKQNGALTGQGLVWDGTKFAPNTAAVAATNTVAGLGTAVAGKIGRIRGGGSPYSFVDVIYDATQGKWVSTPTYWPIVSGTAGFSTGLPAAKT